MTRDDLTHYLQQLFASPEIKDYCPNGLQIQGCNDIQRIAVGVSASLIFLQEAIKQKADAVIVHHGYFWKQEAFEITGIKHTRIKAIIENDLNLYAYHLPLDVHPIYGNNVSLAMHCGWTVDGTVSGDGIEDLIWTGRPQKALSVTEFSQNLEIALGRAPLLIAASDDKPIARIAWCTGAAQRYLPLAAELGVDAYISGEISEQTTHLARELGIHYFAAGHHATERYGIAALGQHLATHFNIESTFIDCPNPV